MLRDHLQQHGSVHAIWTISVLLLIIAWLALNTPNGELIGQYIGLAASVASLVLALAAIGYAFVSNQGLTETVGALRETSGSIGQAAENIASTSAVLATKAEELTGEVSRVPSAVEALSARLDQTVLRKAEEETTQPALKLSDTSVVFSRTRLGGQLALFIMAKSFKEGKPFDAGSVFGDGDRIWDGIVLGAILSTQGLKPFGIEIESLTIGTQTFNTVKSLGSLDADLIINSFSSDDNKAAVDLRQKVDTYFGKVARAGS